MSKIVGFTVVNKKTGEKLATLPLTIPIGSTVEGFQEAGYEVSWTWEKESCQCRACYAQKMGLAEEAIDNWETEKEKS